MFNANFDKYFSYIVACESYDTDIVAVKITLPNYSIIYIFWKKHYQQYKKKISEMRDRTTGTTDCTMEKYGELSIRDINI